MKLFATTKIPLPAAEMVVKVEKFRVEDPDSSAECGIKQIFSNGRFISSRSDDNIPSDEIHKWNFIGGIE